MTDKERLKKLFDNDKTCENCKFGLLMICSDISINWIDGTCNNWERMKNE